MKRLLLFLLLAAAGTAALVYGAGGIDGPLESRPAPIVEETTGPQAKAPRIETGKGTPDIDAIEGITQPAPPRRIVWVDRLSDERIEIPTFMPWRFMARDARPLQRPDDERQGVLCRDVSFQMYREPESRAEAMALARNEEEAYAALLHQRFTADEARVFGRLGEALSRDRKPARDDHGLGDTELKLDGNVVISDLDQGLEVRGASMTIWPEQDRVEGDGLYTLRHEALMLEGRHLVMERDEAKGWSRVSVEREPVLRIVAEGRDKHGNLIFDFGRGEFRPATITADGRAILVRQEGRTETTITVTLSDNVTAVQEGGRRLNAGHVELVATRSARPETTGKRPWKLQHFRADQGVKVAYPGRTREGGEYLTSVSANRLLHDVPLTGSPSTVLQGNVSILLRGEIPVLGPGGRLRLLCRERAWIGPLPAGAPSGDLDRTTLQQIGLRGAARIERELVGPTGQQDILEAEAIDLIVQPRDRSADTGPLEMQSRMVAVHFAALGDVLLGGTRVRGSTHRLIGDALHTDRPHVSAEGRGTRFEFPDLGQEQRLLGPDSRTDTSTADTTTDQRESTPKGRWELQRFLARGAVDITTSVGGPAVGIPAHLTGDEVSYDRLTRRAQLSASAGAPARIAWSASRTQTNQVETRVLTFDRGAGRLTATGGVQGELYVARRGDAQALPMRSRMRDPARLDSATLSVHTDERIDLHMRRAGTAWEPATGEEQVIRIRGPVTTELRAADNSVDRMRSESLEVALVFLPPKPTPSAPSAPTARVAGPTTTPPRDARTDGKPLERLDVQAGALRVDLEDGDVSFLEGTAGVDLKSGGAHVRGDHLTYEDRSEVVVVRGTPTEQAVVFLGATDQRSEVRAARLRLQLAENKPVRLEAYAPTGRTSDVHLFRNDRTKLGQLEWFAVTYDGRIVITNDLLDAQRVRVIRRLREPGKTQWGDPAVLRSPTLRVFGRSLLATEGTARDIVRIVAEGPRNGSKDEVHFLAGSAGKRLQIWGQRFDFDVVKKEAQLTGLPGRDVTMQRGDGLHLWYTRVTIDMKTNLPSAEGSRILWRPRGK